MALSEPPVHRLTVDDVFKMVAVGVLDEDDRVELLDGVLVDMRPTGPAHAGAVAWLTRHFVTGLPTLEVRVQDTFLIAGGFVEPDLMVCEPVDRTQLPHSAHLVVEVAVTSLAHDRHKAARYARAGVGEFWIVDVERRVVTVHRGPGADGYADVTDHTDGAVIQALVGGPPIDVSALLG